LDFSTYRIKFLTPNTRSTTIKNKPSSLFKLPFESDSRNNNRKSIGERKKNHVWNVTAIVSHRPLFFERLVSKFDGNVLSDRGAPKKFRVLHELHGGKTTSQTFDAFRIWIHTAWSCDAGRATNTNRRIDDTWSNGGVLRVPSACRWRFSVAAAQAYEWTANSMFMS